jgi:hypothetical protein
MVSDPERSCGLDQSQQRLHAGTIVGGTTVSDLKSSQVLLNHLTNINVCTALRASMRH